MDQSEYTDGTTLEPAQHGWAGQLFDTESPAPHPAAAISVQDVTKRFGEHTVLDGVSFAVPRGKISAVLGPSGTGKSVLLNVIIGLMRPEGGQVYIDDEPIVGITHREILRIRHKFGVMFQDGALFGSMDVYDNIAFPIREHTKKSEEAIGRIVRDNAEMLGIGRHLHTMPANISGGMRKRAGLARALALNPEIVFFDEPDSGLDPVRVAHLDSMIRRVQYETGCTFFVITHNVESVRRTADYVGMLFRSRLVGFGAANDMLESQRPLLKQFFAGSEHGPIGMDELVDAEADESLDPGAAPLLGGEGP